MVAHRKPLRKTSDRDDEDFIDAKPSKKNKPPLLEGYWKSKDEPKLPMPRAREKPWVGRKVFLAALGALEEKIGEHGHYKGHSICRICKCANGSADYKANGWQWPEGLIHYVKAHNVKPSEEFIEMVMNADTKPEPVNKPSKGKKSEDDEPPVKESSKARKSAEEAAGRLGPAMQKLADIAAEPGNKLAKPSRLQQALELVAAMSSEDMRVLNHDIVERLKARRRADMRSFSLNDDVEFSPNKKGFYGTTLQGKIVQMNRTTVTVLTTMGQRWRVSPGLLVHSVK